MFTKKKRVGVGMQHFFFQGKVYVMLWLSSLVTGTANDAFFMMLPIVDNFWQVSLPKKK